MGSGRAERRMNPTKRWVIVAVSGVTGPGEHGDRGDAVEIVGRRGGGCLTPRRLAIVLVTTSRSGRGSKGVPSERSIPFGGDEQETSVVPEREQAATDVFGIEGVSVSEEELVEELRLVGEQRQWLQLRGQQIVSSSAISSKSTSRRMTSG